MRAAGAILACAGIALLVTTAGCAPVTDAGVARGSGPTASAASVAPPTEAAGAHAGLFQRLESDDEPARKGALEEVRRMGTRLTPALLERLVGLDSRGAYVAAVSLGALGDRRAVEPLIWVLDNSPSFGVRYAAVWALGRLDDRRAVPVLVRFATTGRDEDVRDRALVSLQQVDEAAAVDALARTANDRLPGLSGKAYARIADTRDPRAVPALIRALDDASFGVRYHAERALFEIGDPLALMPLVRIMQDRGRKRAELYSREEREWIAEGLGRMGDQRAVPHLVDVLADPDPVVRRRAAAALGQLGDPRAIPSLAGILRDSDGAVREAAEEALGQIGGPEALRALLSRLRELGYPSRLVVRVGKTRDPGSLGVLLELLRENAMGTRTGAAYAIGRLDLAPLLTPLIAAARRGDEKAIAEAFAAPERNGLAGVLALHALLDGPDELARQQAGEALARAGAFTILDAPPIPEGAREAFARGVAEFRKENANFSVCSAMFKRAVELAPWWAEARFNYGLVGERWPSMGKSWAVHEFEAYLALVPDAANAGDVRARIARLKQPKTRPARGAILDFSTPAELISMVPPRSAKPEIRKPETPPFLIAPDRRAD